MSTATENNTVTTHTLPASWWTSPKIFDLEMRSIFYKSWLYTSHESRFKKAGDYFLYNVAGLSFFLIKNKNGEINAFHNVCRHRAYPVVQKESGSSTVLGCRYHGWSYNTDGNLTKAPQFDNVEGFDKSVNGLYKIHTHVTKQGLVFINFDASEKGPMPFEEFYAGLESTLDAYDFSDYEYHMSYELDGKFNWKTLMDGYQECYHCPTAHPGLAKAFKMPTYKVNENTRWCRHEAQLVRPETPAPEPAEKKGWFSSGTSQPQAVKEQKKNAGGEFDGLWVYTFPTNGINCYSPCWYTIRVLPISVNRTILQYDIYRKKGSSMEETKEFVDFLQEVEIEDFDLCEATQKNLNTGIYSTGVLHPNKENGVLFYQRIARDMVLAHVEEEKKAGKEINPATLAAASCDPASNKLEKLCSDLECGKTINESVLAW